MATQIKERSETRSERLVVLVSPSEKRAIEKGARAAKMSLSDFVRSSAQNYAKPSEADEAMMKALLQEVEDGNARIDSQLAELKDLDRQYAEFNEDAYKAKLIEQWDDDDVDWRGVVDMLGLGRRAA